MPTVAEPVSVPEGRSGKALFSVGAVGCGINTIAAIWFSLGIFIPFGLSFWPYYESYWTIGYFLLVTGLSLACVGYLGTHRNYGSGAGAAGFAVAIVVSILFILCTLWEVIVHPIYPYSRMYWWLREYVMATIYEIFFAMVITWGVTHINTRRFTGISGLSLATGIMLILTAVFAEIWVTLWIFNITFIQYGVGVVVLQMFEFIWTLLFFVSEVLAATLFFMAKAS